MQIKVGPDTLEKMLNEKHFQKKQNPRQQNQIKDKTKQNRKRLWYLSTTEDKNKFSALLNSCNIKTSMWECCINL